MQIENCHMDLLYLFMIIHLFFFGCLYIILFLIKQLPYIDILCSLQSLQARMFTNPKTVRSSGNISLVAHNHRDLNVQENQTSRNFKDQGQHANHSIAQKENISKQTMLSFMFPQKYFNFTTNSKLKLSHPQQIKAYYEQFQCTICYDVPIKPVRCRKCRQVYCIQCVAGQKTVKNTCAFRCKGDFMIEKCHQFTPTFCCPVSKFCQEEIKEEKDFVKHGISCKFSTPSIKQLFVNQQQFKCSKGLHSLEFYTATCSQMMNFKCSICEQKNVLRACCRICDEKICLKCRPLVLNKYQCPIGHKLQKTKGSSTYICDLCSLPSQFVGDFYYHDYLCNFGFCELCYESLPSKNKVTLALANQPDFCSKVMPKSLNREPHRIKSMNIFKEGECKLCQVVRNCPQICQKCEQRYCLNCKPFLADSKKFCHSGHPIKQYQNLSKLSCDKCLTKQRILYWDQKCNINLCQACLQYGIQIVSSRRIELSLVCPLSHSIKYYIQSKQITEECHLCKKVMPIKIFCEECGAIVSCPSCFPIAEEMCYLGHKLRMICGSQFQEYLEEYLLNNQDKKYFMCHRCGEDIQEKQMLVCYFCNYHVCLQCNTLSCCACCNLF